MSAPEPRPGLPGTGDGGLFLLREAEETRRKERKKTGQEPGRSRTKGSVGKKSEQVTHPGWRAPAEVPQALGAPLVRVHEHSEF